MTAGAPRADETEGETMTKKLDDMTEAELIWKAEGEALSAQRIAEAGGDPRKAIGFVISALRKFRQKAGV
jgi:hypothetical protein